MSSTAEASSPDAPVNVGLGCDRWADNYIERPHDSEASSYYPNFDIVEAQFGSDSFWIYSRIITYPGSSDANPLNGSYGIEIDLNLDTRGDLLILAHNPDRWGTEWNMTGVQVWRDANDDVGGETAVFSDGEHPGDGYEELIFDQGEGEIPEAAWVRISPDDFNVVEFAFKPGLLEGHNPILWWVWASMDPLEPSKFDYVDSYNASTVYGIDNSCSWVFGGLPRGDLANHCPLLIPTATPTPTKPPKKPGRCQPPGTPPPGAVYWDYDNCEWVIFN